MGKERQREQRSASWWNAFWIIQLDGRQTGPVPGPPAAPDAFEGHRVRRQQRLHLNSVRQPLAHAPQLALLAVAPRQQRAARGHARRVVGACRGGKHHGCKIRMTTFAAAMRVQTATRCGQEGRAKPAGMPRGSR